MAPIPDGGQTSNSTDSSRGENQSFGNWRDVENPESFIVESWGEGFLLGSLMLMSLITLVNMRRGAVLHKLILLELVLAMGQGTFCFMAFDGYGWYLSSTAALLYCSYFTHNVVAWLKIRPFFAGRQPAFEPTVCKWVKRVYLTSLATTAPALVFQIFNNFRFFNNESRLYERVRPYEPLMRDPWWIFSCLVLFYMIRRSYSLSVFKLVTKSPRLGILLGAILLAVVFTTMDVLASVIKSLSATDGINPYWKLALVFKCLSDNIILDNFQTVLQQLKDLKAQDAVMPSWTLPNETNRGSLDRVRDARESPVLLGPAGIVIDGLHKESAGPFAITDRGWRCPALSATGRLGLKIRQLPHIE